MAGNSLGGGAAEPMPEGWGNRANRPRVGRVGDWNNAGGSGPSSRPGSGSARIATFRDLVAGGGGGGGPPAPPHSHDDDDDEEDDPREQEYFAGGERSGVAITNPDQPGGPNNTVRNLLEQAQRGGVYNPPEPRGAQFFSGGGHLLGSDEVDSQFIPDPNASEEPEEEEAVRHLHLWRDGFSIEDGPLMRYDDPENQRILEQIHAGRAPPSVMNVHYNQPVQLVIAKRTSEDYQPPRPTGTAAHFSGSGNRLGAPVPEASSSSAPMPGSFPVSTSSSPAPTREPQSLNTRFEVDQSKPTTSVQVRLADGTRIVARVNLTHTVGDLRNFINASRPGMAARAYTIGTTFPNRTLEDGTQSIEAAGLKNSVVVQRWADA